MLSPQSKYLKIIPLGRNAFAPIPKKYINQSPYNCKDSFFVKKPEQNKPFHQKWILFLTFGERIHLYERAKNKLSKFRLETTD